jgi:hypothetical protein
MGYDGIHPRVLKNCAAALAIPITLIIKQSIATGEVPDLWKKSNITPIFKKGSKLVAANYRPVSLTSIVCKIQESIIHDRIMNFCVKHDLISKAQHGFVHKRGCTTNLLKTYDILTQAVHEIIALGSSGQWSPAGLSTWPFTFRALNQ